jgi:hypothetical protein
MIALTILCLASTYFTKESSSVCLVQRCHHQTLLVASFANNQIANFTFNFPKKITSSLSGQDNTFSFPVSLSYIDSRQCLYFTSCSPTMIADNIFPVMSLLSYIDSGQRLFLWCPALLHWQRTMSLFHVLLSYIDSGQCLYFMSCSPTLTADNIFISCPVIQHW